MATAYLKWSESSYAKDRAQLVYQVVGAKDADEAQAASGIPQLNSTHPFNTLLLAGYPLASNAGGPFLWEVRVDYSFANFGGIHSDPVGAGDPLNIKPRYEWSRASRSLPADISFDGYPLVNGAGDPFDPPKGREIIIWNLTIVRNQRTFDFGRAAKFQNAINTNDVTVKGPGGTDITVKAGTMHSIEVSPQAYDESANYVTIVGRFEIQNFFPWLREDLQTPQFSPFHDWRASIGYRGLYKDSAGKLQLGRFATASEKEGLSFPVRTNPFGKPIGDNAASIFVRDATGSLKTAESNSDLPKGASATFGPSNDYDTLVYKACAEEDFSDHPLLVPSAR